MKDRAGSSVTSHNHVFHVPAQPHPHRQAGDLLQALWLCTVPSVGFGFIDPGMNTTAMAMQLSSWGFPAFIAKESCQNFKQRHGICIRNGDKKALRSVLLLTRGQMSVRIPLA